MRLEKNLEIDGKARATEGNGVPCHVDVMYFKAIGPDEREKESEAKPKSELNVTKLRKSQ